MTDNFIICYILKCAGIESIGVNYYQYSTHTIHQGRSTSRPSNWNGNSENPWYYCNRFTENQLLEMGFLNEELTESKLRIVLTDCVQGDYHFFSTLTRNSQIIIDFIVNNYVPNKDVLNYF